MENFSDDVVDMHVDVDVDVDIPMSMSTYRCRLASIDGNLSTSIDIYRCRLTYTWGYKVDFYNDL